ncbi:MAG: MFS transporter [Flavobacteriales bacterium AspAUS03]
MLYFFSTIGSDIVPEPYSFSFCRFIEGFGFGAFLVAEPSYISEIFNTDNRGCLVTLFRFNIVFEVLLAYIFNYLLNVGFVGR